MMKIIVKDKTMEILFKEAIWKQFGGSMEMLENAISMCPEQLWDTETLFWYKAYHCLFYTDYYLTLKPDTFSPPEPFTLSEFDESGAMPPRTYTKEELIAYSKKNKEKCRAVVNSLTSEILQQRWVNEYRNYSVMEILIYNMRHIQHHAAQLNILLRQGMNRAPEWVSHTKQTLNDE